MTGRHIHLMPLGGLAGDMFAAAMLDALPDLRDAVLAQVRAVLPPAHDPPALAPCTTHGLRALRFTVPPFADRAPAAYPALAARIDAASGATRAIAADILRRLAQAEAQVHGCALDQVHFHEIADWDTLADVTAAGAILAALDGTSFSLAPLPLGGGTVETRHGTMPVPAPATAVLLQGLPVHDDGIAAERVTPTGAAIAAQIAAAGLVIRPPGRLAATGHGAGTRALPGRPNILIAQVIDTVAGAGAGTGEDTVTVLEFDIDDMTAEEIAAACDSLRGTPGVLDLVTMPLAGKKGRTATGFRLLATPDTARAVADACFRATSTLGLRTRTEARRILARDVGSVQVAGRAIGLKAARRPDGTTTHKAESDDLAAGSLAERRRLARKAEDDR